MPLWRIELFGGLRATRGDQVLTRFRTRKTAELLAYLAYRRERTHPRDVLIELFWPECDPEAGRHSLSMAISSLRQQLEPPGIAPDGSVLVADRHAVGVHAPSVETDVAEFETALAAAERTVDEAQRRELLTRSVELYRGEFLAGHYEDWIIPEQHRLDEMFFQAMRRLTTACEQAGDHELAIRHALRCAGAHRLREDAHREVIRLYLAAGQPEAALRQFRELERLLREELDATPGPDTQAMIRAMAAAAPAALPVVSTPALPVVSTPGDLEPVGGAVPLNSRYYVVRAADQELEAAIRGRHSVVLICGPRQVGKTSLLGRGLQAARATGARAALTHFQVFNQGHLETADSFLTALAESIADQLDLDVSPADTWQARRGPNPNFRRFLRREVLSRLAEPLVWGIDEADRLFTRPFAGEVFALIRSWHDERALEPDGPCGTGSGCLSSPTFRGQDCS